MALIALPLALTMTALILLRPWGGVSLQNSGAYAKWWPLPFNQAAPAQAAASVSYRRLNAVSILLVVLLSLLWVAAVAVAITAALVSTSALGGVLVGFAVPAILLALTMFVLIPSKWIAVKSPERTAVSGLSGADGLIVVTLGAVLLLVSGILLLANPVQR